MWTMIMERMPSMLGFVCTALAFLIPFTVHKINQKLHEDTDPPWKKEEQSSN